VVADIAPVAYERRHDEVLAGFAAVDLDKIENRKDADKQMAKHVPEIAVRSFLLKNLELFIKGEKSSYILPKYKEAILALFPNASVKVIADTEHWLHAEKPEVFAGIVKRFLA